MTHCEEFEPEVLRALTRSIKPGAVVLDIGANIGYFTEHMSRLVGASGSVHAFEPDPKNFSALQKAASSFEHQNVVLHPSAVGKEQGQATLHLSDFSSGMHRLYESQCCGTATVMVEVCRLDSLFKPGEVSVLKMDVEGYEPYVIEGALELIREQPITIVAEHCPPSIVEAGASVADYIEDLKDFGFTARDAAMQVIQWAALLDDAQKWEQFGRERLVRQCAGKSNPEIAIEVEKIARSIGCSRPYIENVVFERGV